VNFQQLEYILAVDATRHFARAADKCFVTQPTLSMMIQKLEEELDLQIFDRSKQPVVPTKEGEEILRRARQILAEADQMKAYSKELKGEITGELRLGIIPTLAPYLLPLFLSSFSAKYPNIRLRLKELVTDDIVRMLKDGSLDMGILATPLNTTGLNEFPIFYEEFIAYTSKTEKISNKRYLLPEEINPARLWLLEEGHCLRSQVLQLCELNKNDTTVKNLHYEAGSIETLINLVDSQQGITIVPWLATLTMTASQRKRLVEFAKPKPVREVSLVCSVNYPRKKLQQTLFAFIKSSLPDMAELKNKNVLDV
jgi:LysR family transcriptional regulator, hydrogen peroxide-inducible genes activator